jgi:hypothetical protein
MRRSEGNDHPQSGWLGFSAVGRKDKKHASASIVAPATACIARGINAGNEAPPNRRRFHFDLEKAWIDLAEHGKRPITIGKRGK